MTVETLKGIYILVIELDEDISINVGAIGRTEFDKGIYAYVGSAQINVEKRVQRHLRKNKPRFWHIDYFLNEQTTRVVQVLYKKVGKDEECKIATAIAENNEPVEGFGCSDCKCKSHLFKLTGDLSFLGLFSIDVFPSI